MMVSPESQSNGSSLASTIDPQTLSRSQNSIDRPYSSKRFNPDEWEEWMQWDGTTETASPHTPSDHSSPSYHIGSISQGSTSPSEAESLSITPLTPVYQIPFASNDAKTVSSVEDSRKPVGKKRKIPICTEGQEVRTRQPKGQKISHNVIEKRYRTNLNDKIARLRDSVPVLKTAFEVSQKQGGKEGADSGSEESGSEERILAAGLKFNKATVLTKATEYIEQLERANAKLLSENSSLRRRVKDNSNDATAPRPLYFRVDEANTTGSDLQNQIRRSNEPTKSLQSPASPRHVTGMIPVAAGFQRLRAEAADQPSYAPRAPNPDPLALQTAAGEDESSPTSPAASVPTAELIDFDSVRGAIPMPDYLRSNRVPISQQQHYAPSMQQGRLDGPLADSFVLDDEEPPAWWPRNRASKLLLGSLAGLMIMEGFNVNGDSPQEATSVKPLPHHKRFLPKELYTESRGFRAQIRQRIITFAHSPQGKSALPVLVLSVFILGFVFLALVYWSRNDPKARRRANSVSSDRVHNHLEAGGVRTLALSFFDGKKSANARDRVLQNMDKTGKAQATELQASLFREAVSRVRGCWRILTQGDKPALYEDMTARSRAVSIVNLHETTFNKHLDDLTASDQSLYIQAELR